MEAVAIRVRKEDEAAEKQRKIDEWKRDVGHLKN